uniref:Uncharacterized protein n=1 Tax=Hyaloperonospora arabidopsidis (strain Emoy2) TaxID=559515 RepID=M4BT09_HYAAE
MGDFYFLLASPNFPIRSELGLKPAADGLHWYFETELPELDTESDGTRSSWTTHLRQHGVVFYEHSRHHRYA